MLSLAPRTWEKLLPRIRAVSGHSGTDLDGVAPVVPPSKLEMAWATLRHVLQLCRNCRERVLLEIENVGILYAGDEYVGWPKVIDTA